MSDLVKTLKENLWDKVLPSFMMGFMLLTLGWVMSIGRTVAGFDTKLSAIEQRLSRVESRIEKIEDRMYLERFGPSYRRPPASQE